MQYNTTMFGFSNIIQRIKSHFQTVVFSVCTRAENGDGYTTFVVAEPVYSPLDGKTIVRRWVYMDIRRTGGQYRRKTAQLMDEAHFKKWYLEFA